MHRVPCSAHGLFYDTQHAAGCVLCQREQAASRGAARGSRRSVALLAAALAVVAGALVVARSGALDRVLAGVAGPSAAVRAAVHAVVAAPAPAAAPLRVLFVGNSLTAHNDLVGMIGRLATSAHVARPFEPQAVTFGGFTLRDHLAAKRVEEQLERGRHWDAVVLQEQGQRPGWSQQRETELYASARVLDAAIKRAGARTVLYSTMARREGDPGNFPGDDYAGMQARVDEGYALLADQIGAGVVPVGRAWKAALQQRPTLSLWLEDGQHPSVAGSYLAACTFYAFFYRQSPVGNAYLAELPVADARALQGVADLVVLQRAAPDAERTRAPTTQPEPRAKPTNPYASADAGKLAAQQRARALEVERDRLRHERIAADIRERELRAGKQRVPIAMYKTAWCGACQRASAYMQRKGIAVREYDVERDAEARARQRSLNPRGGVPTIDVDGAVLIGWSESRFEAMLAEAASRHSP